MKENIILVKTYKFALRIINLHKYLVKEKKEFVLSKQILRCGTSIGANSEEGASGQTHKDFITKFAIALKEARETHYWLRLLKDSKYISQNQFDSLSLDCEEILRLLVKIQKTAKGNS